MSRSCCHVIFLGQVTEQVKMAVSYTSSSISPLYLALLEVSQQLTKDDLDAMKFLVKGIEDKPGDAELEQVQSGIGLFELLMKNLNITDGNNELVDWLLSRINRKDLIRRFHEAMKGGHGDRGERTYRTSNNYFSLTENKHANSRSIITSSNNNEVPLVASTSASSDHHAKRNKKESVRSKKADMPVFTDLPYGSASSEGTNKPVKLSMFRDKVTGHPVGQNCDRSFLGHQQRTSELSSRGKEHEFNHPPRHQAKAKSEINDSTNSFDISPLSSRVQSTRGYRSLDFLNATSPSDSSGRSLRLEISAASAQNTNRFQDLEDNTFQVIRRLNATANDDNGSRRRPMDRSPRSGAISGFQSPPTRHQSEDGFRLREKSIQRLGHQNQACGGAEAEASMPFDLETDAVNEEENAASYKVEIGRLETSFDRALKKESESRGGVFHQSQGPIRQWSKDRAEYEVNSENTLTDWSKSYQKLDNSVIPSRRTRAESSKERASLPERCKSFGAIGSGVARKKMLVSEPTKQLKDVYHVAAKLETMSFAKSNDLETDGISESSLVLPSWSSPTMQSQSNSHQRKKISSDKIIKGRSGYTNVSPPVSSGGIATKQSMVQKKLRKYQEELAHPAKSGDNYIICAPTGSGKTLTAASICRHSYDKAKEVGHQFKALFIVNIRYLTQQQTIAFREAFPVGTVATIGETDMLHTVLMYPNHAVVMVTAQILVNALNKKPADLNLQDISMIIFDECHHTTQSHPYNEIMKRYLKEKKMKLGLTRMIGKSGPYLPQIIGLSASLGVGHGKDAYRHILTLCGNMDAKNVIQVRTHVNELDNFVNSPEKDVMFEVRQLEVTKRDLGLIITDIMSQIEGQLWARENIPPYASQMYEEWVVKARIKAEEDSDRNRLIACLYLFEYNRSLMLYEDLRAVHSLRYLEAFMERRYVEQEFVPIERLCRGLFNASNADLKEICHEERDSDCPKLEKLAKLLRAKFLHKPHSKGIVLTRMRLATEALVDYIKETRILRDLPQPVKPVRLVGQGETNNYFMTESEQKTALKTFREDDSCNLLVATDIAQEGLDMPACNFVIRYNFVSNEIGTVQSKGRARAKQSECFLIVKEGSLNANRELANRKKVIAMQEAMEKLNGLSERKRLQEITERQEEIYDDMETKEETNKQNHRIHDRNEVEILCKECNMHITLGCYMRKRGCHYTCVDPDIKKRIAVVYGRAQVFRDTRNVGTFKCGNRSCGQQLGIAIDFFDGQVVAYNGYGFRIGSFLFKLPNGTKRTFKKWTKVTFDIPEMNG